jgi:hypothetical protein
MTPLEVARRRLHNERLVGPALPAPADVVHWLVAVQSQDYAAAKWAIALRAQGCSDADVEQACDRGDVVRTHVLRPTWHFVAPRDLRWLLEVTAPRILAASAYYHRQVELDERTFARSNAAIVSALQGHQHMTRVELARALENARIRAAGTRLAYLVMRAELDGLVCNGPRRGKQFTYALVDERIPKTPPLGRDEALAELARRYFASHGPATVRDFAWWSGLTVAEGARGIELAKLERDAIHGKTYWHASVTSKSIPKGPKMHLLPNYDEYLVAYQDRDAAFDPELSAITGGRENAFSNVVVRDGRVIGWWRRTLAKAAVTIETSLFVTLDPAETRELRKAAERYGRFLGLAVKLTLRSAPRRGRLRANRARSA